jgi:hypothetical protein
MLLSYSLALCAMSVPMHEAKTFFLGIIGINYCIFMIRIAIRRGVFK